MRLTLFTSGVVALLIGAGLLTYAFLKPNRTLRVVSAAYVAVGLAVIAAGRAMEAAADARHQRRTDRELAANAPREPGNHAPQA